MSFEICGTTSFISFLDKPVKRPGSKGPGRVFYDQTLEVSYGL
jgi:hypothetical protein